MGRSETTVVQQVFIELEEESGAQPARHVLTDSAL